jgi:hypothetical protein
MKSKHDYLIEQVFFTPDYIISGGKVSVKVNSLQPCKLLLWVTQFDYIYNSGDYYNYTDSYIRKKFPDEYPDNYIDEPIGNNISINQSILLNGKTTVTSRPSDYFDKLQPLQYLDYQPAKGSNMISFSLYPTLSQPSGSCNLSQIEYVDIGLQVSPLVTATNQVKCRSYTLCYNVLRIAYGFAAPVFVH